jgi:hypothetical protein
MICGDVKRGDEDSGALAHRGGEEGTLQPKISQVPTVPTVDAHSGVRPAQDKPPNVTGLYHQNKCS